MTPCQTVGRSGDERTTRADTYYLQRKWERTHGQRVPPGSVLMHLCDEPRCSNIEHLRVGTYSDNMQDCSAKGRLGGNVHGPGEAHGLAKLTDADVRAIRGLASGGVTQTALAARFGVTQPQVSRIVNRRLWRHVN